MENDDFDIESLFEEDSDYPDYLDDRIRELEESLEVERVRHKESQFISIIILVILLDVIFFRSMQTFGGPLVIGVLEAVALLLIARKMGLKDVSGFLNRLISTISRTPRI